MRKKHFFVNIMPGRNAFIEVQVGDYSCNLAHYGGQKRMLRAFLWFVAERFVGIVTILFMCVTEDLMKLHLVFLRNAAVAIMEWNETDDQAE